MEHYTRNMSNKWSDLVDQAFDNLYVIKAVQSEDVDRATFLASTVDGETPVVINAVMIDSPGFETQRESWRIAQTIRHDNLVRVLGVGEVDINGMPMLYCAKERHDDQLAEVLDTRPLTEQETRSVLEEVLPCLDHLHRSHVVHGAVNASNILAFGNRVKLAPDTLRPDSPPRQTSDDVHAIGLLTMEMLRGHGGVTPDIGRVSAPLRELIAACLDAKKRQTLTPAGVLKMLSAQAAPVKPRPPVETALPAAARPAAQEPVAAPVLTMPSVEPARSFPLRAALAVLAAVILVAVIWQSRRSPEERPAPATAAEELRPSPTVIGEPAQRARTQPPTEPAKPVATQQAKQPSKQAAVTQSASRPPAQRPPQPAAQSSVAPPNTTGKGNWAVIAATYRDFDAAQKRGEALRRQFAQCECSVYPAKGEGRRYYVLVGAGMAKPAADDLQRRARASRFPSDTYVTLLGDDGTRARAEVR
jgi:hypothetical protein